MLPCRLPQPPACRAPLQGAVVVVQRGVAGQRRNGLFVALNYSFDIQHITVGKNAKILVYSPDLKPVEVLVWQE